MDIKNRVTWDTGGAPTQDGLAWAADESLDERVLDKVRQWLEGMEKAADRAASRAKR